MSFSFSGIFIESTSGVFFNCSFKTSNTELLLGSNFLAFFSFSNALEFGSSLSGLKKVKMRSCELPGCLLWRYSLYGGGSGYHFIHHIFRVETTGVVVLRSFHLGTRVFQSLKIQSDCQLELPGTCRLWWRKQPVAWSPDLASWPPRSKSCDPPLPSGHREIISKIF